MGPRRKKSRPNTQQPTPDTPAQAPDVPQHNPQEEPTPVHSKSTEETDTTAEASKDPKSPPQARSSNVTNKAPARSSWYAGGSWRAKASPVAQVARESISVAGGMTSESSAESSNARPTRYMHNSLKRSSKSIPIAASETRIHATSSHSEESIQSRKDAPTEPKNVPQESSNISEGQKDAESKLPSDETVPDPPLPPEPSKDDVKSMNEQDGAQKQHAAGWFGWWSRPDGYASDTEKAKEAGKLPEAAMSEARSTPLPTTPGADLAVEESDATVKGPDSAVQQDGTADVNGAAAAETTQSDGNTGGSVGRSWFGLWSRQQNRQTVPQEHAEHIQEAPPAVTSTETAETAVEEAFKPDDATTGESTPGTPRATEGGIPKRRSSGWAFWSKDRSKDGAPSNEGTQKQVGELAVADTPSQSHPEAAQFNEQREQQQQTKVKEPQTSAAAKIIRAGRGRSSTVGNEAAASAPQSPVPTRPGTPDSTKALEATKGAATKLTKQTRPNLVIPKFRDTYPPAYIPTYLERVTGYLASSLRIADAPTPPQHVSISPTVPKIQSAIAIGVHGYFPAPLLQKVLGQPTGTSIRFANYASAAVRSWIDEHQPDVPCDIETVALEGEGFIDDRVNTLWKLLLNWLSHLRTADLILVACHSQGVPVAVVLVSKLIQLGCLSPNVKIGVCAMAGVNLGPFSEYKSRFVGGSMAELFEFSRADSKVSKEYRAALDVVFRYGVRITYIGSLDDQLVPLEVSTTPSRFLCPYASTAS